MDYIKSVDKTVESSLSPYLKKTSIVKGVIHLLIVLYAAKLAPELPKEVTNLFTNAYFRLFIFTLILWTAQFSPSTSLLIALAFMVTVNYATSKPLWEFMENVQEILEDEMPSVEYEPVEVIEEFDPMEVELSAAPIQTPAQAQAAAPLPLPNIVGTPEKSEVTPAAAPAPAVEPEKKQEQEKLVGCYPARSVDMAKVSGASNEPMYGSL